MSNVIKRVNVYTSDGRSFGMDEFDPISRLGKSQDEYSNRVEKREYQFNGEHITCYENVTIENKNKPTSHKFKWHKCSDDCKEELNLAAFDSDYQEDKQKDQKCSHIYMEVTGGKIRCILCGDVQDK